MNELATRTLTGAIMIVTALLAAYVGGDIFRGHGRRSRNGDVL